MKKTLSMLLASAMCLLMLVGCQSNAPASNTPATSAPAVSAPAASAPETPAEVITFRAATDNTETSNIGTTFAKFEELVEAKSNGTLQVDVYYNGVLGSVDEALEQVSMGALEMCSASTGSLGSLDNDFNAIALPYIFEDREDAVNTFNEKLSDVFVEKAAALNLKLFPNAMYDGTRCYYTNGYEINSVADCEGIKMRVADREVYILPAKAVGMVPVAMSFNEAYMAVQQGTVDGLESVIAQGPISSLYDICDYLVVDKHMITLQFLVMNPDFFNSLSDEHKTIIEECAAEAAAYEVEFAFEQEDGSIAILEENGMTVTYPDVAEFEAACADAREKLASSISPDILALVTE